MKRWMIALLLLSPLAQAEISVNAAGKTLDQFFVMASQIFQKAVIVDPGVDGTLKVYGVSNANFKRVFHSILRAHNLTYLETDDVIRVRIKRNSVTSNISDKQSLFDYIVSVVADVYITGSMAYHSKQRIKYDYAFVQANTRRVFEPENIGLTVTAVHSCLAQLSFDNYKTFVTCEPYKQLTTASDEQDEPIPSLFKRKQEDQPETDRASQT